MEERSRCYNDEKKKKKRKRKCELAVNLVFNHEHRDRTTVKLFGTVHTVRILLLRLLPPPPSSYRLAGLVVKASALGAEDPGFESRLRRDFSESSHTSAL